MQRKIFIGIDLDDHLKKAVTKSIKKWKDLPIKWHKEGGLHIALLSLGWVGEDDVLDINATLADFCFDNAAFSVDFEKIIAMSKNPEEKDIAKAQVVKLIGEESEEMRDFYTRLTKEFDLPVGEKKKFRPYVDIGRMRACQWQDLEEYPQINVSFPVTMDVTAITLFEGVQMDGKRQIVPIEIFELQ